MIRSWRSGASLCLAIFTLVWAIAAPPAEAQEEKDYLFVSEINRRTARAFGRKDQELSPEDLHVVVNSVRLASLEFGIPLSLLMGLFAFESGFLPEIRSSAGARGIAQVMPFHFDNFALRWGNTRTSRIIHSVFLGAHVLRRYYEIFKDWNKAILAYNNGPGAVKSGRIPNPSFLSKVRAMERLYLKYGGKEWDGIARAGGELDKRTREILEWLLKN